MARARNIKPGFFKNENLCEAAPMDRLLFAGLWCLADREGRLENRPKKIKMELFPCDDYDVAAGLASLESLGFIKSYQVEHFNVIQVVNFLVHQVPHGTEKDSELPDFNGVLTVNKRKVNGYITGQTAKLTVRQLLDNGVLTVKELFINALNPESLFLNPESLNPESLLPPNKTQTKPNGEPKQNPNETPSPSHISNTTPDAGESDEVVRLHDLERHLHAAAGVLHIAKGAGDPCFPISKSWKPSEHFDAMAIMAGIRMDDETRKQRIAEFVSYWAPRGETKTQADWDHGLLKSCIHWKNQNPLVVVHSKGKAATALHNFENVDYSYGVKPDGSF